MNKKSMTFIRVRWQGKLHEAAGVSGHTKHGSEVTIYREQFPVGFATEDVGLGAFTARFEVFCVHPDSSGEYAWICTEIMDLDAAAKMPKE
ncbi:MAG: hypothetical protein WCK55_02850 [Verrucomicrobiota bacterium]